MPAFRAEGFSVVTNKAPSAPYRGAGRPEAILVIERLLDRLAAKLGLDPAEVRSRNLIAPAEMPYRPGLVYRDGVPVSYDGGDYPLELRRALDLLDYAGWRKRQAELRAEGRRVGLGIAGYLEAGGSVRPGEWATVKIDEHGHVEVLIGVSGSGQGHETVFAQVCAEYLGAAFDDIRVRGGDTTLVPYGYGTGASRVAVNTGNAVAVAATAVKEKAVSVAAGLLECAPDDVRIEDSRAFVVGAPARTIPLGQLARVALRERSLVAQGGPGLWATKFYAPPTVTWSSGVHAAVVEVDVETGRVAIVRYVIVHDCGRQLHPVIVDGQIVGGFAQGLGVVLGEHVVYGDDGQLLTSTLMDYPIPRADDMPPLVMEHLHFDDRPQPARRPRRRRRRHRTADGGDRQRGRRRLRRPARDPEPRPHARPRARTAPRSRVCGADLARDTHAQPYSQTEEPMARLTPITSKNQVAAKDQAVVDSIVASRGALQGPFTMFLHSPELAGRLAHLGAYVRFEGSLDMRVRVLAAMTVARELEAVYVWGAQTGGARKLNVPEATITAIRENHSRGIPPEDAQIVEFTRQLMRKHRVDEATMKSLIGRFGNDGFIQLTGAIGYYSMLSMTVNACELEAAPGAEVLKV